MRGFGPRALTPRDGWNWLIQAWQLMRRRPWLFVAVALFAPTGSALLLALPVWEWWLPMAGGWVTLTATVFCYGLPLSLTVSLACGLARAVNRKRQLAARQLLNRTAFKALARAALFLFLLLLQGYLLAYWVQDQLLPAGGAAGDVAAPAETFGIAGTILGTQLSVLGSLLLILQFLLAVFAVPLQLFRELPLAVCWRRSALAMQLNPWLFLVLGMIGLALLSLPFFKLFAILAQILALPLSVYLGVLLYVAWNDVFQSGAEEEEILEMQEQWRADISGGSVSRQSWRR
ncbi:MAG: hypothetical protein JNM60_07075 [Candidatus Competibacteraceae bacterium]|nr:hypothetical protein [Candidatus Competibacteraceae bacterium]